MSLHPPLIFVGDRPNPKKNLDMETPFVGTVSYKTLLEWLYKLNVDINRVNITNAYDVNGNRRLESIYTSYKVVALGEAAYKACLDAGYTRVFKLPHPSGLNRSANDKAALAQRLAKCKKFIYEE